MNHCLEHIYVWLNTEPQSFVSELNSGDMKVQRKGATQFTLECVSELQRVKREGATPVGESR